MQPTLVGIDVGGTFTDLCAWDGRALRRAKVPTTPDDLTSGVRAGLAALGLSGPFEMVAGSTVATNTLLERRGERVAFLTTAGFADLLFIGRQNRPRLFDLRVVKPEPLVAHADCHGIGERVEADGSASTPLDEAQARAVLESIRASGINTAALCLLFSYLNPKHEERIVELGEELGVAVHRSSLLSPEFREFERASTTVINAYVAPRTATYLRSLDAAVREAGGRGLRIMQSNGGQTSAKVAAREPVRTILSGPAGGAVAAAHAATQLGRTRVLTYDMGGTSTDVALFDEGFQLATESQIDGWPIRVPMLGIHTVGKGGGSIAEVDAGGVLQVGPRSAGADPGPACYGRGEFATVTDANVVLGRLPPDRFLGGRMRLDIDAAARAFDNLAGKMNCGRIEAAQAVVAVANAGMEHALSVVSAQQGFDPAQFELVSFGGAGSLHAVALAEALGLPGVIVPMDAGIFSATGMILADVVRDFSVSLPLRGGPAGDGHDRIDLRALQTVFGRLMDQAADDIFRDGYDLDDCICHRSLDLRYVGQAHELTVPVESLTDVDRLVAPFHALHAKRHGTHSPDEPVEAVTARVRTVVETPKLLPPPTPRASVLRATHAGERDVFFGARDPIRTPLYERDGLVAAQRVAGPALIVEDFATTLIPPDWQAEVAESGHLLLTRK